MGNFKPVRFLLGLLGLGAALGGVSAGNDVLTAIGVVVTAGAFAFDELSTK